MRLLWPLLPPRENWSSGSSTWNERWTSSRRNWSTGKLRGRKSVGRWKHCKGCSWVPSLRTMSGMSVVLCKDDHNPFLHGKSVQGRGMAHLLSPHNLYPLRSLVSLGEEGTRASCPTYS